MQKSKTYFEQIPVAVVKQIAEEFHDDDVDRNDSTVTRTPPSKLKPHRLPSRGGRRKACLTMQILKPEINCSLCGKRVAIETAKTDEVGQAVHEECYLLKIGVKTDPDSVHRPEQMQT